MFILMKENKQTFYLDCHIWTKKYIQGLNEKLRQSKGYYRLKLVVVGKKVCFCFF